MITEFDNFEIDEYNDFNSPLEYDIVNRVKYHPEIHFMASKPFSNSELEYLCKFHECDGMKSISMGLGRTEASLSEMIARLKKNGKYYYYLTLNNYV